MATGSLNANQPFADLEVPGAAPRPDDERGRRTGFTGWFDNLQVQTKAMVAFIVIFGLMFAQAAFVYRTSLVTDETNAWLAHTDQVISSTTGALADLNGMEAGLRAYELTGRDDALAAYNDGRTRVQASLRDLRTLTADNPSQVRRWDELERLIGLWQGGVAEPGIALRRDVAAGRASYDALIAYAAADQGRQQLDAVRALFAEAIATEHRLYDEREQQNNAAETRMRQVIIGGSLATLIVGLLIATGLSRIMAAPMRQLTRAAAAIAEGRQDQQVDFRSRDETGQLAEAFRSMIAYQRRMALAADAIARGDLGTTVRPISSQDVLGMAFARMVANLRELVGELQAGTGALSSAGAEILAASAQQAAGATEQSAAIAETTATVDEVRASAAQAVGLAEVVGRSAGEASRVAAAGVAAVGAATTGMAEIRERVQLIATHILALAEQGQQIGALIATVGDLADQSHLLALNAAIEASRAGAQGRGFAVVAQEIRTLAEGSKGATAQVRAILSDIQRATNAAVLATEQGTKGVDAGVGTIAAAGQTIDELSRAIGDAAGASAQIAAAVRQHAVGMEQIAAAMGDINGATAQNLAAVTNTQQAAQHLTDLADRLDGLIDRYQM